MSDAAVSQPVTPFESASELREAHASLLEALDRQLGQDGSEADEADALRSIETQIRQFLERGAATGVYLEEIRDRTDCQVLLDYWVSSLLQAGLQVSGVRLARFDGGQLPDLKDKPCPYVGLEAFRDQKFFFGRGADTQTALDQVRASPLVVVLGASGSGKSSLVMAGVLPALAAQETPPALRIVSTFVPGDAVLNHLADAVLQTCGGASDAVAAEVARLRQDPSHLYAMVGGAEAPSTLITIDQFEEVFTLSDSADRETLVANLAQLLKLGRGHRVILTMREEFRNSIVALSALKPHLNPNEAWYSMRPMGYEELRAAIERPAALVNLQFQAGIVDDLVRKVLGQPAALPLLQFTLRALWEERDRNRITWEVYRRVGDPLNALESSADQFCNRLAPETQDEVKRILLELVRVDELLEAYRQPVRRNSLFAVGKANTEEVLNLLAANDYVRITSVGSDAEAIVEVKHESLIRNWRRFVKWIDEKRHERRERLALTQAAERWMESKRPREGLLTKWQVEQAKRHSNLSNLEREFVDASTKAIDRIQRKKERRLVGGLMLLVLLLFLGVGVWALDHWIWQDRRQEWRRTWGELDALDKMTEEDRKRFAENRLDGVAIYLWNKRKEDLRALDTLMEILQMADRRELFKPEIYEVTEWAAKEAVLKTSIQATERAVLTVEHAKDAMLSKPLLQMAWQEFSESARDKGVLIPPIIRAAQSHDAGKIPHRLKVLQLQVPKPIQVPKSSRDVKAHPSRASNTLKGYEEKNEPGERPKETKKYEVVEEVRDLKVVYDRSQVLLKDIRLDDSAKALLAKYKPEWGVRKPFEELKLSHWWWVPRWTIPIWKAAGHKYFYPPEAAVAIAAVMTVEQQPDLLYADGFVVGVLQRQARVTPELVEDVCEALGGVGPLRDRITRSIKEGYWLSDVEYLLEEYLLDEASQDSKVTSVDCDIDRIGRDLTDDPSIMPIVQQVNQAVTGGFNLESPIRVYIADSLVQHIAPSGTLSEEVLKRIEELRSRIKHDLGYSVPGVRFRRKPELDTGRFMIEVHNERDTPPLLASARGEVDDIMRILEERLVRTPHTWLDIREVTRLISDLPDDLRDWLSKKYTPAKLKRLLREALRPGGSEYFDVEAKEEYEQPLPGATLTHFSWLIRSLAFWGQQQVCPPADYACLGKRLQETQKARIAQRLEGHSIKQPQDTPPGIDSLVKSRFDEAEGHFQQWLSRSDHRSVINTFKQAYPKVAAQVAYKDVEEACSPKPGEFAGHEALVRYSAEKIEDLLGPDGNAWQAPQRRLLELCLISSQSGETPDQSSVHELIRRKLDADTSEWTLDEKYWLSYLALRTHLNSSEAKDKAPPPRLTRVETLLSEAIRGLHLDQADAAFEEIGTQCSQPGAGAWCWQMLTRMANLRPDSYWIPFIMAYSASQLNREGAHLALQLLERAERNIGRVEEDGQQEQQAWLAFTRGLAHQTLADLGAEDEIDKAIQLFDEAIQLFKELRRGQNREMGPGPEIDLTYGVLADALLRKAETERAAELIEEGLKLITPDEPRSLLHAKSKLLALRGQFDEALELFTDKSDEDSLFERGLSRMFGRKPIDAEALKKDMDDFLATSHPHRDYLRLIYYWTLVREGKSNDAERLLTDQWNKIDTNSWPVRLAPDRGDYIAVWQEKLIGYYLNKVRKEEFSEVIKDVQQFEASPFNNAEISWKGFLFEWYFYDALLQSLTGDPTTRRSRLLERLKKAVDTKQVAFNEYSVAQDLIRRINQGEDLTLQHIASGQSDDLASQPKK